MTMPRLSGIGDGPLGRGDAERRVVVLGVVGEGTAVDRLVAAGFEVLDDGLLEFVSGVVRAEVDAHGGHPTFPSRRSARRHQTVDEQVEHSVAPVRSSDWRGRFR